jgi:NTE family protein
LLPEFEPVEIDGRLLADGGLHANLPMDVVLREAEEPFLCCVIDLFSPKAKRFKTLGEAICRRQELLFVSQGRLLLDAYHREERLRAMLRAVVDLLPGELRDRPDAKAAAKEADRPGVTLVRMVCGSGDEIGFRTFDYSQGAIRMRWEAGERAAAEALRALEVS